MKKDIVPGFNTLNHSAEIKDRKTICVLGSARSGTSMVAGLLILMGINMGDRIGKGNNEDQDFLELTRPLKELLNNTDPGHPGKLEKIRELIHLKNKADLWGWKDPQSIFYFNRVDHLIKNPYCIIIFRDPLAIAQREIFSGHDNNLSKKLDNVINHRFGQVYKCFDYADKKGYPLLLISYERAIRQKNELVNNLSSFLGIDLPDNVRASCCDYIQADRGPATV